MRKLLLSLIGSLALITPAAAVDAAQKGWSQGYVVYLYSSGPGWKGGETDANCPDGDNKPPEWAKILDQPWRREGEIARLLGPGAFGFTSPVRDRGPERGMNVFRDPSLYPEVGQIKTVKGHTGYGFDLDDNPATGWFATPDGTKKGIDNNLYKVLGCQPGARARRPRMIDNVEVSNTEYTMLVMLSGEGADRRNDPNVRVGFYLAKEQIVKDAKNYAADGNSYRIDPDPRFMTVFDATSKDGLVTPKQPLERLNIRDSQTLPSYRPDVEYLKPKVEITLRDNERIHVEFGGYRNWRQLYWGYGAGNTVSEVVNNFLITDLYRALEREADYNPDPISGRNTHISSYMVMDALPAFLITPETNEVVARAELFKGTPREAYDTAWRNGWPGRVRTLGGDPTYYFDGATAAWAPSKAATQVAGR